MRVHLAAPARREPRAVADARAAQGAVGDIEVSLVVQVKVGVRIADAGVNVEGGLMRGRQIEVGIVLADDRLPANLPNLKN